LLRSDCEVEIPVLGDRPGIAPLCSGDNLVKGERGSQDHERKRGVLDAGGHAVTLLFEGDEVPKAEQGQPVTEVIPPQ